MLSIRDCKTEYKVNPQCVDCPQPRFSWKIESDKKGVRQISFRIVVMSENRLMWDSGTVFSSESRFIKYAGLDLKSRQQLNWCVTVTAEDENGVAETATGRIHYFGMGLLSASDWICKWIEPETYYNREEFAPCPYLRKSFDIKKPVKKAVVYQTAHGLYNSFVNGESITDDRFNPGLTSYYYRIQYQVYDITPLLLQGKNVWSVILADGWWRGSALRNNFGYRLHFFGQIEIEYTDGTKETIITDESFRHSTGGLLKSDMKSGDIFDASAEPDGWKNPDFDDCSWEFVHAAPEHTDAELIASRSVPVREKETFTAKEFRDSQGRRCLDFGQNIAGYVKMKIRGCKQGQVIRLTHGEMLLNGAFYIGNIHTEPVEAHNFQCVTYISDGRNEEEYCPVFSVFGFRYLLIEGYEGEILPGDFIATAVYSDLEETGDFTCSNEKINRLVRNARWSQKGNFLDVATDCPTRERNAWTGDSQVYVRAACNFMNVYPFFEKWLQDQTAEQYASGKVGITFPSTSSIHQPEELPFLKKANPFAELAGPGGNGNIGEDCAGWGDAAAWNPYVIYLCYGDKQILKNQYITARKWVDYMLTCAKENNPLYENEPQYSALTNGEKDADFIFDTRMHYGEWQEPIEKKTGEEPLAGAFARLLREGKPLVATAYMRRSAENVALMAKALGNETDYEKYRQISERIAAVYDKWLIGDDGTIEPGHQAAYVRALAFRLCGEEKKPLVISRLIEEIEKNDYKLNTGFLSTPFLLPVLCNIGCADLAYRILEQEEYPSWLYSVNLGATTIPESWHAFSSGKDSLNHYSYGAVCEFLFAYTAGIRPCFDKAGYSEFELCPVPGGTLTSASAVYESPFGTIRSSWKNINSVFEYTCTVPANTTAHLTLPDGSKSTLGSGNYKFRVII